MAKRKTTPNPKSLPPRFNVWQVDARRLEAPLDVGNMTVIRPWIIVVASETDDRVLRMVVMPSPPTTEDVWQTVVGAMTKPTRGKPHRPSEVQIRRLKKLLDLQPTLSHLGIQVTPRRELPVIDRVIEDILEDLAGDDEPGLLDMPGVTPQRVESLFEAAAEFYRQAPWKKAGGRLIKVKSPGFEGGLWYAVILDTPPGFALYDRPPLESEADLSMLAVLFGEKKDMPAADLEAVEQYRWKVAGRKAYPAIYRKEGGRVRAPEGQEQELLEACLRALLEFVKGQKAGENVTMGKSATVLSWVN